MLILHNWTFDVFEVNKFYSDDTAYGITAVISVTRFKVDKGNGYRRFKPKFLFSDDVIIHMIRRLKGIFIYNNISLSITIQTHEFKRARLSSL